MSKRLQVIVDEAELRRFRRTAKAAGLTLSEWARQTLRRAERSSTSGDPSAKLAAIRNSATHQFPTGDIDDILAEIERGYLGGGTP